MMRLLYGEDMFTYGPYTYILYHSPFEFNAAETACSEMNASLVVIYNETFNDQLENFIQSLPGK